MHPLTELTPGYFCIEVENDAKRFHITPCLNNDILSFDRKFGHGTCEKTLKGTGWQLLGICSEKEIDFDVEDICEMKEWTWGKTATPDGKIHNELVGLKTKFYRDFNNPDKTQKHFSSFSAADSFRSLLASKGLISNDTKWVVLKLLK